MDEPIQFVIVMTKKGSHRIVKLTKQQTKYQLSGCYVMLHSKLRAALKDQEIVLLSHNACHMLKESDVSFAADVLCIGYRLIQDDMGYMMHFRKYFEFN